MRDLDFKTDEFFGAIRETHNARADDPAFERLTFCIIGTVAPTDLIRDVRLSPFNIGTRIKLVDFAPAEAAPLAGPLPGTTKTLERVLWWTSGHPYLTQRLCAELSKSASVDVDGMVSHLFFSKSDSEVDENIKNVRNSVLRMGGEGAGFDCVDLLTRYGRLASGKRVVDDDPAYARVQAQLHRTNRLRKIWPRRVRCAALLFDLHHAEKATESMFVQSPIGTMPS